MGFRQEDCRGIWVPAVTPFRDEALCLDLVPDLVDRWLGAGIRGLLVLGTTGEAPHVGDAEAVEVVGTFVRAVAGRVPVVAGSGRGSTAATIELGRRFADAGADALMVLTPHAYRSRVDAAALRRHYTMVAGLAPVPVFVYHMPDMTGLDLAADLLADLVHIPNIWGFKDSSSTGGPLAAALQSAKTIGFVGSGVRVLPGLEAGAAGAILAIADAGPEPCVALFEAWRAGDLEHARLLQERATAFTQVLRPWGVAGIKAAMALRGWEAGPIRAPLRMPDDVARGDIRAALERFLASP
jgi:dihydrodipicolinate synthase/N-acetylneuraminate lyase